MNENIASNSTEQQKEHRVARGGREWFWAPVLILAGLILLGENLNVVTYVDWPALLILLPALGLFGKAVSLVKNAEGRITRQARSAALFGMLLVMVTGILLFNLNWTILGPVMLMLAGTGILVNAILPE